MPSSVAHSSAPWLSSRTTAANMERLVTTFIEEEMICSVVDSLNGAMARQSFTAATL